MSEKKEFEPLDVGATERVDWRTAQGLKEYVKISPEGKFTWGGNAEIDGELLLNSGLAPIETYQIGNNANIQVFIERAVQYLTYSAIGLLTLTDNQIGYIVIANYTVDDNKKITYFVASSTNKIFSLLSNGYVIFNNLVSEDDLKELQPKLYRHILTMVATTEEGDPETSIIEYISTNNLKVDSLQDLTTLLKPTANFIYPLGPVVNADLGGITDYNHLEYSNSVWKFASSAPNTTKINVTSVSDTVTTL